jgi:RNA polymerase sigma factor (sigma-70 family)
MADRYTVIDLYEDFGRPGRNGSEQLLRYIQRKTRNEAVALDIVGTLWFRAAQRGEQGFEGRGKGKAWLYKVATNLAYDYGRSRKTDFLEYCAPWGERGDLEDSRGSGEVAYSDEAEYPGPSPEDALLDLHDEAAVLAVLSLAGVQSRPVLHRRAAGQKLAEIAEDMNMPLSAVKARFYRGKAKLIETLVRICLEDEPH